MAPAELGPVGTDVAGCAAVREAAPIRGVAGATESLPAGLPGTWTTTLRDGSFGAGT